MAISWKSGVQMYGNQLPFQTVMCFPARSVPWGDASGWPAAAAEGSTTHATSWRMRNGIAEAGEMEAAASLPRRRECGNPEPVYIVVVDYNKVEPASRAALQETAEVFWGVGLAPVKGAAHMPVWYKSEDDSVRVEKA